MLKLLPDIKFPVTSAQTNAMMDNLVQLNVLDAGVPDRGQKALDILLHTYELKAKTAGVIDYTGQDGHRRLLQDAMNFVGDGSPIVTRHGDMRAAHLAIDYSNTQIVLKSSGMTAIASDVNALLDLCRDLMSFPMRTEERMGLFLTYLKKKSPI